MAHEDREKLFEKALTRQLRPNAPAAPGNLQGNPDAGKGACPDEEILAAYHERVLTPGELISWKEHIAGCTRCQQILAHLEVTDEIPLHAGQEVEVFAANPAQLVAASPAQGSKPLLMASNEELHPAVSIASAKTHPARTSRRSAWQWVAPAGAIAAGLLVWVSIRENKIAPAFSAREVQVAKQKSLPEPSAAPMSSGPLTRQYDAKNDDTERDEDDKRADVPSKKQLNKEVPEGSYDSLSKDVPLRGRNMQRLRLAPSSEAANSQQNSNIGQEGGAAAGALNGARSSSKPYANQVPGIQQNAATQTNNGDVAAAKGELRPVPLQAQQAPSAPPPPLLTQNSGVSGQPELNKVTAAQETSAFSDTQSLKEVRKSKVENKRLAAVIGGNVIWRVGLGGFIAQSRDGGRTFTQQESGITEELTAAMAPSDSVCWAVGRSGTILRTLDGGAHWTKLISPTKQNLGGVRAEDGVHAKVWDVTNQTSFMTTDGGVTWIQVANE